MVTVQDIFTVQTCLGSEDTEGAEVAAARPAATREIADTCFSTVSDTCTCGVRWYPRQVTARGDEIL